MGNWIGKTIQSSNKKQKAKKTYFPKVLSCNTYPKNNEQFNIDKNKLMAAMFSEIQHNLKFNNGFILAYLLEHSETEIDEDGKMVMYVSFKTFQNFANEHRLYKRFVTLNDDKPEPKLVTWEEGCKDGGDCYGDKVLYAIFCEWDTNNDGRLNLDREMIHPVENVEDSFRQILDKLDKSIDYYNMKGIFACSRPPESSDSQQANNLRPKESNEWVESDFDKGTITIIRALYGL